MIEELISEHLKILRTGANLSQEKLAEKLGVTRQTINAIERKRKKPSKVQAIAIYYFIKDSKYTSKILGDAKIE